MFRIRKKIPLDAPVTLEPGDKLRVTWQLEDMAGGVWDEEVLVEDYVQEGETATYDTAIVMDFWDEFDLKYGYIGGVAKEK